EGSGIAPEVSDEPHLKGSNKEAGVTPEVLDRPANDSSSSSSEIAVEDISSDDDKFPVNDADMFMQVEDTTDTAVIAIDNIVEVTKNDSTVTHTYGNVKMTDVEMNLGESEVQSMLDVPFTQATLASLRHPPIKLAVTLSPDTTTIPSSLPPSTQPIQVKTKRFVKKSTFPNSQDNSSPLENRVYRLERKVDTMSKFNLQAAIDKSLEERLKQIELSKRLPNFGKIKLENATKKSIPTPS
ncbi:hypothetical protein Tco_0238712, partial [Tanacetum coccineum]